MKIEVFIRQLVNHTYIKYTFKPGIEIVLYYSF